MWSLITGLPGLVSGLFTTLNGITSAIANERLALIGATTEREKAEIGERISALHATQAVLVAESATSKLPIYVQSLMTLPWVAYIGKVVVWDKLLGWGSTDGLDYHEWYLCYLVFGFWFVHATVGLAKS